MYKASVETESGFTLIELLITIVVLAILGSIAIPAYLDYTRRSHYGEIVQAAAPFKASITECYQKTADFTRCSAGSNHIPAAIKTATGAVASLTVVNGVITVTPVPQDGILATDTYILTPSIADNKIIWTPSGGGVKAGYIKQ